MAIDGGEAVAPRDGGGARALPDRGHHHVGIARHSDHARGGGDHRSLHAPHHQLPSSSFALVFGAAFMDFSS